MYGQGMVQEIDTNPITLLLHLVIGVSRTKKKRLTTERENVTEKPQPPIGMNNGGHHRVTLPGVPIVTGDAVQDRLRHQKRNLMEQVRLMDSWSQVFLTIWK
jgi:hypothetical protein